MQLNKYIDHTNAHNFTNEIQIQINILINSINRVIH